MSIASIYQDYELPEDKKKKKAHHSIWLTVGTQQICVELINEYRLAISVANILLLCGI